MSTACPSCGAVISPGSERCDLCGTAIDAAMGAEAPEVPVEIPTQSEAAPVAPLPAIESAAVDDEPASAPSFCISCGHANVAEARYCNRCGTQLPGRGTAVGAGPSDPSVPAASEPVAPSLPPEREDAHDRPDSEPGRRALWLVGLGVLVVIALYAITNLGRREGSAPAAEAAADPPAGTAPAADAPALDPATVADLPLPDSLRRDSEAAAALVDGAERVNTAAAWDDAGRLYLDLTRRAAPEHRPALARQAIATFQRSLAVRDDPDVRTRMVSAYRYDPATTMQPVMELQRVLEAVPNHPEANFQMGELRLQIGRADSAVASFARAAASAPAGSVLQRDATMMMERAREAATAPPATAAPADG